MAKLSCIKQWGMLPPSPAPGWFDSVTPILGNDGYIHFIGGAFTAIVASNKHFVIDPVTLEIIYEIDAPWPPIGETGVSKILGGNKIVRIGGAGGAATDAWVFDPSIAGYTAGSWSEISNEVGIGDRRMAAFVSTATECFIFGGWNNDTYVKTSDFVTFTPMGDLPNAIKRISACASGVFNGLIWLIGGSTNMLDGEGQEFLQGEFAGMVWTYDPNTDTFNEVNPGDTGKFGTVWIDFATTATNMYVGRGFNSGESVTDPDPDLQGNKRGVLISPDGNTWTEMDPLTDNRRCYYERHRASLLGLDATRVLLSCGFSANDAWIYDELG